MNNNSVKLIAMNAILAGVYAAFTLVVSPIAYGEIQFRLSEVLVLLAFYNKKYIPGLVLGCLLSNLASPLGMIDIVVGTFSTIIVCIAMYYLNNRYLAAIVGGIITGIIIGAELAYVFEIPFVINALFVGIGEAVVLLIGAIAFRFLESNTTLMKYVKVQ